MPPALACLVRFSHSAKRKRNRLLRKRVRGSPISYSVSEIWLIFRLGYWILENWRGRCGIVILLAPYKHDKRNTRLSDLINDERYREMLLKRTGIPYSRKKKTFLCMLWTILLIVAVKGFVYRFMYVVRVREKMAGKVICRPHSVFGRLATKNVKFICGNFCEATTTTTSFICMTIQVLTVLQKLF